MRRIVLLCCALLQPFLGLPSATNTVSSQALASGASPRTAPVAVVTQRYDNSRTGANLNETILTTANVNVDQFGRVFTRTVDGQIYAQPLYVPNLDIPGQGTHNVVFVATMHNSVYAYDADDPAASTPLWHVNLGPSAPVPNADFGNRYGTYHDISVEVGIVSTPVIDLATNTIYVVALTKESDGYHHRLHALDLTTGVEKGGGPVDIEASVPGTGDDAISGTVALSNTQELQRPALLLANGVVYVSFGSYADTDPYHGWLLGYDATTLQLVSVFNDTPNAGEGGIWQAGWGPSADGDGNIYVVTGNGSWDADTDGVDYGDSVVKLSPVTGSTSVTPTVTGTVTPTVTGTMTPTEAMTVADWFTPYNQFDLADADADLGSSGALLIPDSTLLVTGDKQGMLYVLDRTRLGHFQIDSDSQIVQSFQAAADQIYGNLTYWNGPAGQLLYMWGASDVLKAFALTGGLFDPTPAYTDAAATVADFPGATLALSANGTTPGSGILWASRSDSGSANWTTQHGILQAFDASNIGNELWNSNQDAARDDVSAFAKFNAPTVANGKVYLGTFSGYLAVYGLLPPDMVTLSPTATLTPTATLKPTATLTPTAMLTPTTTATLPESTATPIPPSTSTGAPGPTDSPTPTAASPSAVAQQAVTQGATAAATAVPTSAPTRAIRTAAPTLTVSPSARPPATTTPRPTRSRTRSPSTTRPDQRMGIALPRPWVSTDVGAVANRGGIAYARGTFKLSGSGRDIWSTADAFHFVYQLLSGDGEIVARVAHLNDTNVWAKAGVMLRDTLKPDSAQAMIVITPHEGTSFEHRFRVHQVTLYAPGPRVHVPSWVRLIRHGAVVTAYLSGNGVRWTRIGSASIALHRQVFVGLAVTAHSEKVLCQATFDHVLARASSLSRGRANKRKASLT